MEYCMINYGFGAETHIAMSTLYRYFGTQTTW